MIFNVNINDYFQNKFIIIFMTISIVLLKKKMEFWTKITL